MGKSKFTVWELAEQQALTKSFFKLDQNIKATAEHLGISRPRVLRKLRKYNLYKPLRRA